MKHYIGLFMLLAIFFQVFGMEIKDRFLKVEYYCICIPFDLEDCAILRLIVTFLQYFR